MPDIVTKLSIAAPPSRVWSVLTDFDAYPTWNRVIPRMRGDLREGATVRLEIRIEKTPPLRFVAKLVRCVPERELAWRGGAPIVPRLAWGEHYFRLDPEGDGTLLTHGERFGGLLALIMSGPVYARTTRTYDALNAQIKARAEG